MRSAPPTACAQPGAQSCHLPHRMERIRTKQEKHRVNRSRPQDPPGPGQEPGERRAQARLLSCSLLPLPRHVPQGFWPACPVLCGHPVLQAMRPARDHLCALLGCPPQQGT